MSPMDVGAPQRQSAINRELGRLQEGVAVLTNGVDRLIDRITPILRDETRIRAETRETSPVPSEANCPLSEQLTNANSSVALLASKVEEVLRRLEL